MIKQISRYSGARHATSCDFIPNHPQFIPGCWSSVTLPESLPAGWSLISRMGQHFIAESAPVSAPDEGWGENSPRNSRLPAQKLGQRVPPAPVDQSNSLGRREALPYYDVQGVAGLEASAVPGRNLAPGRRQGRAASLLKGVCYAALCGTTPSAPLLLVLLRLAMSLVRRLRIIRIHSKRELNRSKVTLPVTSQLGRIGRSAAGAKPTIASTPESPSVFRFGAIFARGGWAPPQPRTAVADQVHWPAPHRAGRSNRSFVRLWMARRAGGAFDSRRLMRMTHMQSRRLLSDK